MAVWQYLSDDGTVYQVATENDIGQASAGDLAPSDGTDPVFPALATPRHMVIKGQFRDWGTFTFRVMCNPTHPAYLEGPGATVSIEGLTLRVVATKGETHVP